MTEAELIAKSRAGDAEAFGMLVRRYEDKIFNLAQHVCAGAPQETEGIYQETFLTAFKKIGQFKERSQLGTWLYRIASNLCLMRLRKNRRRPHIPIDPELHDPAADPARDARKKELQNAVVRALETLSVQDRLIVTLRDIQGLSAPEVARILEISVPAVKSRLHRARLVLRDRLSPLAGG